MVEHFGRLSRTKLNNSNNKIGTWGLPFSVFHAIVSTKYNLEKPFVYKNV
jgi:hypothetical protein